MSRSKLFTSYEQTRLRAMKYAAVKRAAMLMPGQRIALLSGQILTVAAVAASNVYVCELSKPVAAIMIDYTSTEALNVR
jgi:hypothetical protein